MYQVKILLKKIHLALRKHHKISYATRATLKESIIHSRSEWVLIVFI